MKDKVSVLIVGAGPSGLSMAMFLARYGISFRIIDKNIKPVTTSNALAIQTRTLDVFDDLGMLDEFVRSGIKIQGLNISADHTQIVNLEMKWLDSQNKFLLGLAQHDTEKIFINHLHSKNITIEMETALTNLTQLENTIEVTLEHKDKTKETIEADWLIACDGSHSNIREMLNVEFKGQDLPQHFVMADAEINTALSDTHVHGFTSEAGLFFLIPYRTENKKYWRILADATHDEKLANIEKLSYGDVRELAMKRCPISLDIQEPIWTSRFYIHERMISHLQHKRIFFVGDAAHIHSPAGGQGMNTGIQDAYNLAWKLALVIKNKAKPTILNTYSEERAAVAKDVLRNTTRLTKMITIQNPILRQLRNGMLFLATKLHFIQKKMINTIGELTIQYSSSDIVKENLSKNGFQAGTRMINMIFDNQSLLHKLSGNYFNVLLFMGIDDAGDFNMANEIKSVVDAEMFNCIVIRTDNNFNGWEGEHIFDHDKKIHHCYGTTEPCIYVIRPDKYIGYRGKMQDIDALKNYITFINTAIHT